MSDEGEKTCPLCAEEMDLTDQQLKPCKCGYEICVWCWHHIMDMAEKDVTEGRCPACRTPYNKERIVGTAAKCERLVSEMSVEKKLKSQKGKSKTLEGRKQLGSVRVIQRNLVYVVGLPLSFADEDLLQRREYFAQYGKVLKVSISRTTTGAIQQFPNSTCSVYITYSKEDEAVRCIQLVHGFVLDGRPLRACFGTTKYCHAWLRNVPCTNSDCLYLHEVGSQEDSFTKDEIISAYTRSRIQQVTGSSNSMQRRSGNVLPPPGDEYCNTISPPTGQPVGKTATNAHSSATSARISPPNSSSGRSTVLPAGASWATRPSSNQALPTSAPCFDGPPNNKTPDMSNGPLISSKAVASQVSSDTGKKKVPNEEKTIPQQKSLMETYEPAKKESKAHKNINVSETSVPSANLPLNSQPRSPPTSKPLLDTSNMFSSSINSSGRIDDIDGNMETVCPDISSLSIQENQKLNKDNVENLSHPLVCEKSGKAANTIQVDSHELEDDLLSFDNQRIKDPEIAVDRAPGFSKTFNVKQSNINSVASDNADGLIGVGLDRRAIDRSSNLMVSTSNFPRMHPENIFYNSEGNGAEDSSFFSSKEKRSLLGRYEAEAGVDMGESSIISNILSMDFDSFDESLTSPQNLAKILGETDRRQGSSGVPNSWKNQNSSQSRFSFAREEEPIMSRMPDFRQSIDYYEHAVQQRPFGHDFSIGNRLHHEKSVNHNGLPVFGGTEPDYYARNHSQISLNKLSVSKSPVSAPPGFSVPSRAPPGFTSHERTDQYFESLSGNHMPNASSLLRNQYQEPSSGNTLSNGDVEFIDPAILAVGKGTFAGGINNNPGLDIRSSFYEEAKFQSLLQKSPLPHHHNQRFNDPGDSFSSLGDAYGFPSRIVEQTLSNNVPQFSQFTLPQSRNGITPNGQWDGSHLGSNMGMAEILRAERLGFNKVYGGYEEPKIRMPSSGNLYNGAYGSTLLKQGVQKPTGERILGLKLDVKGAEHMLHSVFEVCLNQKGESER